MLLEKFFPQPRLFTQVTEVKVPRFPVIDAHNHLGDDFGGGWHRRPVSVFTDTLDAAHVGCYAENLDWVSQLLDKCPNFYVDFAARIAELGRQPYSVGRFFQKYADRIVFGTDLPVSVDWYRLHYRFLETDDDDFNYDLKPIPSQGRWRIHGLHLPDDVLEKVYQLNARRILNLA